MKVVTSKEFFKTRRSIKPKLITLNSKLQLANRLCPSTFLKINLTEKRLNVKKNARA
jgi:hypothetical protein